MLIYCQSVKLEYTDSAILNKLGKRLQSGELDLLELDLLES